MGLTYEQACRLGLGHEHPEHPSNRRDPPPSVVAEFLPTSTNPRLRIPKVNAKGQNKTEARFDAILEGLKHERRIEHYAFESVRLRLAGRTTYAPDFLVVADRIIFVEVKGHMRDDAAVKVKVAAELHPWAAFFVAFSDKRSFDIRRVTASGGIGRRSVQEWWRGGDA